MKLRLTFALSALCLGLCTLPTASAADAQPSAQQDKMKTCNKDAGDKKLKGDERKAFMKDCLSNKPADKPADAAAKPTDQKEKMKYCNKEAGDKKLKGDARKQFMSDCLKK